MGNFRGTPKFGINDIEVNMNHDIAAGHTFDTIPKGIGDVVLHSVDMSSASNNYDNIFTVSDVEKNPYKYAEDRIISDFKAYIDKTYSEHYKTDKENIECFDAWIALDDATPTFRNTALKYLWRYGKKNGSNKNDLMKALHYTLMCLYNDHYRD